MTSQLTLIRAASEAYVADKVRLSILNIEPGAGDQINPGENFTFSVKATNASEGDGGMRLVDLVWHVWLDTNTKLGDPTWLHVPDAQTGLDAYNAIDSTIQLIPGTHTTVMYVFPQEGRSVLDVGETNRLDLSAVATGMASGEVVVVHFELFGTVDTPQSHAESPNRTIEVVG